ncbi:hypothetical protein [Streptomyces sp. or20]|uniref:hypothetical protein n=1 Tax=Streptomyces sp. or20 TaxID=1828016 RepID=UPI000BEFEDA5|nr:hypothetical protein [Streptomyces sp. or20]
MGERCGTEPTLEELEAEYERARQARIDEYDCSFSSRQLAAKLVDTEDELGGVTEEGLCTGMHADVAEAHCEIERLTALLAAGIADNTAEWTAVRSIQLMNEAGRQRDRYRLAWLSARRRAADEANLGAEAVEHLAVDRDRWQRGHERAEAQLVVTRDEVFRLRRLLRESTHGASMESVGEVDGETVWRLKPAEEI